MSGVLVFSSDGLAAAFLVGRGYKGCIAVDG